MHVEMPFASFLCAVLVLVPLPWHIRARNIATISIILWLFAANLIYGVDSIIWAGNVDNTVPVWCDITSNILTGFYVAIPAACLCICVHLERIAPLDHAPTHTTKTRRVFFQLSMCIALPVLYIAAHYIVQSHRYDIVENFGCRPTTYISVPSIFLMWIPPLTLTVLTLIYAALAIRNFLHRRVQFSRFGTEAALALTPSRYVRLIAMAVLQMCWTITTIGVRIRFSTVHGVHPYTSWNDVHSDFSRVGLFAADITTRDNRYRLFLWWSIPISSVLFSIFLALGEEAINEYKEYWNWCRRKAFRGSGVQETEISSVVTMKHSFLPSMSSLDFSTIRSQRSDVKAVHSLTASAPASPSILPFKQEQDDATFMSATLAYLESPTARSALSRDSVFTASSEVDPSRHLSISSVNWPQPPDSIPLRPDHPTLTDWYTAARPFEGAGGLPVTIPGAKALRRGASATDAIFMTVVKETI